LLNSSGRPSSAASIWTALDVFDYRGSAMNELIPFLKRSTYVVVLASHLTIVNE